MFNSMDAYDQWDKGQEEKKTTVKIWSGTKPKECDICHRTISNIFIDGATTLGSWANMCFACHKIYGKGLGLGKGQKYKINKSTKQYEKVGG